MAGSLEIRHAFMMQHPAILASGRFTLQMPCSTPGKLHDQGGKPACIHGADGVLKGAIYLLAEEGVCALEPFKPAKAKLTLIPSTLGPAWAWHVSQCDTPALPNGDWVGHIGPTML